MIEVPKRYTDKDIETAVKLIEKAKKPYIYAGGGVVISGASKDLAEFAHKIDARFCDTLMVKGVFDGNDPLYT